ncbi:hypothetical protein EV702DRAFT_1202611 [Suillus placidus]|uniref:Uncharacterized protein n=1 Tax=Suillus placidus TaxID=48579 RepID=A0A9P7CXT7_9AGAM|nr:hypothetical protein EV702DRAFT_1202611 [Suillus placidus]
MASSLSLDAHQTDHFSIPGLAALYNTPKFAIGFSNNERQAATRALLRHDAHIDGSHYQTRTLGGLHPSHINFNKSTDVNETEQSLTHSELLEAATQDVFDALTMQDRLDGGISLLFQCTGSEISPNLSPEQVLIDVYITPRELQEKQQQISGDVAVLVQAFAQEFAVPHLRRFAARCAIEKVKPSMRFPATHISTAGPRHLPPPMVATGARIQCSAQPPNAFYTELQSPLHRLDSAAIRRGVELANKSSCSEMRQCRPADAFAKAAPLIAAPTLNLSMVGSPLISIGPHTDAALDRLKLGDENLLKLRTLIGTVHSSQWEAVFRSPTWDLTYEQSSALSNALLADLQVGMRVINPEVATLKPMVSQTFFANKRSSTARHVQLPARRCVKVTLSKEARAVLRLERRAKSLQFRDALDDTWKQLDDATKKIATSHHKSIRQVQNDLYIGRGLLRSKRSKANLWNAFCWKKNQDTENDSHGKALALSKEEQDELLAEFTAWKETKKTSVRTMAKSKINDITQTLKAVENELKSLNCRTGAESILYTTRGSTDVPLRGIAFATQGVENFMDTVMGVNNQDLVSKMEGFAVQGMKGSAKNHQKRVSDKCTEIRNIINRKLQECTGDPSANMQWVHYFRNVVQHYQVVMEGWPDGIPFTNLSQVSSAFPDLKMLYERWEEGTTYWKSLSDEEFEKLRLERNEKLNNGEIVERRRRTRSDKGTKCRNAATSATTRRKQYKSAETIDDDDGDIEPAEPHNPASPSAGVATAGPSMSLIPQPHNDLSGAPETSGRDLTVPPLTLMHLMLMQC